MSSPETGFPTFAALAERIRLAVEAVASSDPTPIDPFRGLYVTDEQALAMARTADAPDPDARLRRAAELLGLDALDAAVLALSAAPEFSPRYGRLFAYLHDDVTRKLPSPGLVARLLTSDGVDAGEVLARFGHSSALRRSGAIRLIDERNQTPVADRAIKVADRLAALPRRGGTRRTLPRWAHATPIAPEPRSRTRRSGRGAPRADPVRDGAAAPGGRAPTPRCDPRARARNPPARLRPRRRR